MAYTFTIGSQPFADLDSTAGRKALALNADSEIFVIHRFHPPGQTGNNIIRDGQTGGLVGCRMRYIGTLGDIISAYTSDRQAWNNEAVEIIDDGGNTIPRCNLMPGTMKKLTQPRSMGRGAGLCFMDVEAIFTQD